MGVKYDPEGKFWIAFWSERHPITRIPKSRRIKHLKSEAEAKRVERKLIHEIKNSFAEVITPTFRATAEEFLESKRLSDWTEKTYQNARICLEAHTFDDFGNRKIDSISAKEIKELVIKRVGDRSTGTQQSLLKFIRGVFQYAIESRYISANPAPNVRFKCGNKLPMVLTEPQARLLLEKARELSSEWYYHWALALYTGMRNGELYALTWDKVNFDNRTILVDTSWNRYDGFKSTKSDYDRVVEIAPNLLVILKELKLKQYDSAFVLPRMRNWDKGEQARMLKYFLGGLGLPQVKFHDLRATWCTMMMSLGVEPIKVMSMGGWKSLSRLQIYVRKAGLNIKGITDALSIHDPCPKEGKVLSLKTSSCSDS